MGQSVHSNITTTTPPPPPPPQQQHNATITTGKKKKKKPTKPTTTTKKKKKTNKNRVLTSGVGLGVWLVLGVGMRGGVGQPSRNHPLHPRHEPRHVLHGVVQLAQRHVQRAHVPARVVHLVPQDVQVGVHQRQGFLGVLHVRVELEQQAVHAVDSARLVLQGQGPLPVA